MNKKLLILLAFALVVVPVAASCGRTAVTGKPLAQPVPHAIDVRYADCLACHVTDQLNAKPLPHTDPVTGKGLYTNAQCTKPGCHAASGGTTTTTVVKTTTTSSTASSSAPASSTAAAGKTLGTAPEVLDANHPAAYATMCLACHPPAKSGDAVASIPDMPTAGTWAGSTTEPGPWAVAAGVAGDHTGRTDVSVCVTCHKFAS